MKYKLSDICEYAKGKIKVSALDENTYISTENMLPNKGGITKAASLPTQEQTQAFMKNDVLVSNIRPYFKKIWYATFDGGCSNDVLVFRAKDGVSSRFLHYVLADDTFFDYSMATSKGTKMPRGDKKAIMEYEVPELLYEDQCKIAGILEVIDEKIELNTNINKNLEEQAQLLFTDRFVVNNYTVAQETKLGTICKCILGGTPSRAKAEYWGGTIPWINSGEINRFRIISPSELITQDGLDHSATKMLPAKTTVLAITGATLGQVSLLEIDACANQSVVGIIPNDSLPYEFIYPFIKAKINELISHQTGGAQQHINKQNVESLPVSIPTKDILDDFVALVSPMYSIIASNCFENMRLENMRDSLLPQLMSGELDVSNIDL
jgi:type I restriction enzyme S subunit